MYQSLYDKSKNLTTSKFPDIATVWLYCFSILDQRNSRVHKSHNHILIALLLGLKRMMYILYITLCVADQRECRDTTEMYP